MEKYNKYQQEKTLSIDKSQPVVPTSVPNVNRPQNNNLIKEKVPPPKLQNGTVDKQIRYPAEDIRFKNKPQQENVAPIPVVQQTTLVSNIYEDDDEDDDDQSTEHDNNAPISQCKLIRTN